MSYKNKYNHKFYKNQKIEKIFILYLHKNLQATVIGVTNMAIIDN
jgi:hypothetical protein